MQPTISQRVIEAAAPTGPVFHLNGSAEKAFEEYYGIKLPLLFQKSKEQVEKRPIIVACVIASVISDINKEYLSGYETVLQRHADAINAASKMMGDDIYRADAEEYIRQCVKFAQGVIGVYEIMQGKYTEFAKTLLRTITWRSQTTTQSYNEMHWLLNAWRALLNASNACIVLKRFAEAGHYLECALDMRVAGGKNLKIEEEQHLIKIYATAFAMEEGVLLADASAAAYNYVCQRAINVAAHETRIATKDKKRQEELRQTLISVQKSRDDDLVVWKYAFNFAQAMHYKTPTTEGIKFLGTCYGNGYPFVSHARYQDMIRLGTVTMPGDDTVKGNGMTNTQRLTASFVQLTFDKNLRLPFAHVGGKVADKIRKDILDEMPKVFAGISMVRALPDTEKWSQKAVEWKSGLSGIQNMIYQLANRIIPSDLQIADPCLMANIEIIERIYADADVLLAHWEFFKTPSAEIVNIVSKQVVQFLSQQKTNKINAKDICSRIAAHTAEAVKQELNDAGLRGLESEYNELFDTTKTFLARAKAIIDELERRYPAK